MCVGLSASVWVVGEEEDHRVALPSLRSVTHRRTVTPPVTVVDDSASTRGDEMAAPHIMTSLRGCAELSPVWSLALAYTISTNPAAGNKDLLMTL